MKPNPMKIAQIIKKIFPYLVIAVLILLLNRKCQDYDRVENLYLSESGKVELYKNKLGGMTATISALELSEKQLKETILQKNDSLKKLASEFSKIKYVTVVKEVIKIDSVKVPFEVQIPCEFERLGKYDTDSHFKFNYALNQSGFSIYDITIPNEQTIITGLKRKWVFGKQTLHTDITNTNPYIHTKEIQTIVVPVKVEWYNNKFVWFGLGAVGGIMIAK